MDHLLDEMIATLLAARDAVHREVEAQAQERMGDSSRPRQGRKSVRTFSQQTDSLLLLAVERNAPEPLLDRVEDFFEAFNDSEDRNEALLATC